MKKKGFRLGKIEKNILEVLANPLQEDGFSNGILFGSVFNGSVSDLWVMLFKTSNPTTAQSRTIYRAVKKLEKKGLVFTTKKSGYGIWLSQKGKGLIHNIPGWKTFTQETQIPHC